MTSRSSVFRRALTIAVVLMAFPALLLATEHPVQLIGVSFNPGTITIPVGDSVKWTNISGLTHTTTSGTSCTANGTWNATLIDGASFSFTFTTIGTYPYFCIPHCLANMTGTVIVEAPVPTQERTWGAIKALFGAQ